MGNSPSKGFSLALTALLTAICIMCIACRASTGSQGLQKAIDPCKLITHADAQRLLGAPVAPAVRSDVVLMATGHECRYMKSATAAAAEMPWSIEIVVYDNTTVGTRESSMFKNATDYFRRDMAALQSSGTKLVPIQNLGDKAYWQPGPDLLHMLDHGVYIMLDIDADFHIQPGGGSQTGQQVDAAKRAAEITLAQDTILPRLMQLTSPSTHEPPVGGTGSSS